MSTMSTFRDFARSAVSRIAEGHRRRQTQHAVEHLPAHLLKDIGWPDAFNNRRGR